MKFYVVAYGNGETMACETSVKRAMAKLPVGGDREFCTVTRVECEVNSETIRLLLAERGGYATNSEIVWEGKS